jgi:succinate dehydrogenase flavin-adding protein (antitoxin of CptAB toxin-antitoxin module)
MEETSGEKYERLFDVADNVLTGVSITLIPFTAGASMAANVARKAATTGAKMTMKRYGKKIAIRGIRGARHIKKLGKSGVDKIKDITKSKNFQRFEHIVDEADNKMMIFKASAAIGGILFAIPTNSQEKSICGEQYE